VSCCRRKNQRKKQPPYYINDRMMGWGTRTDGVVDVCAIATEKYRILREPIVQTIASTRSTYLRPSSRPSPLVPAEQEQTVAVVTCQRCVTVE
jgi:hypothetical protein